MKPLRLAAFDEADLEVVSAHLQDAVVRVRDIGYLPGERRFALVANRFNWAAAMNPDERRARTGGFERRRSGLRFDHVLKAQACRFDHRNKDAVISLLAIRFTPTDAPAGIVTLHLAGGGMIRLEVECIEAAMSDMGPAWSTGNCPAHDVEDVEADDAAASGSAREAASVREVAQVREHG